MDLFYNITYFQIFFEKKNLLKNVFFMWFFIYNHRNLRIIPRYEKNVIHPNPSKGAKLCSKNMRNVLKHMKK